ncbi:riboflavin synthase [Aerococcus sanguinicola]|uniref:riboflavin synthase n=1 Tax=unclassified Aerococcus TaxID=2618060 RepID=UPI0008A4286B|nr:MULTISPECIES: riboflavin synthase [unclassified Aerococcus]MDK6232925.1 riboflavin synthase [Aerococcus sp. UMB10185]MDK6855815.1 riboflavin synthase [Aerococcus sp. UMB7533]MDK8502556.1 riboflavin synthase [Aerococcus sp. UMB1112A]OFN03268.1 riboflavin synthase subunit alpha [Aerococcus sp. HMSC062A02]OHO45323.1 riboflavin synthase subunit alpha [Aerococcus sp. HMSC035B07]
MFTGLIEEVGKIKAIKKSSRACVVQIGAAKVLEEIQVGDSVAVNGICLTVTDFDRSSFTVDVMPQTWQMTALAQLERGSSVNLERAMAASDRFGGHFVSGHIDGKAQVQAIRPQGNAVVYDFRAGKALLDDMVNQGSVAIDGISLTLVQVDQGGFRVSVIPHTLDQTNLPQKKVGDWVNIETDMIGKYVKRFMAKAESSDLTEPYLREQGF